MLESITVKNLALIKESEVILRPGLNILTGETGAGKSIILGSIRLALGERAAKNIIRKGAEYALVELLFFSNRNEVLEKMKELDIPVESDGSICIQRRIMENRSVCKCNGESISGKALKEIASLLINIHGQNDAQTLLDVKNYRDILDDFGDEALQKCKRDFLNSFENYKKLVLKLEEDKASDKSRDREVALAKFEVEEIENARLIVGEDRELEERYRIMKNSQKITEALARAYSAIDMDNGAGAKVGMSVREALNAAAIDEGISEIADNLATAEDMLKDASRQIQDYMDRMEFSAGEFAEVENRLDTYNHLKSKYGDSIEKILEYAEERKVFVERMEDFDTYLNNLIKETEEARSNTLEIGTKLSKYRGSTARDLEKELIKNLSDLNFADIRFSIDIASNEKDLSREGMDKIDFLVSFNKGEELKSLSQVASGGELSRFMLALKAVSADKESIETLVFDEIDAGISGKTAWNVSEKLNILGNKHQVIAITHLPQIAAMADSHYLIEKRVEDDSTITDIKRLGDTERIQEIARMVSGGELSEAGLVNAKELMENAAKVKR